MSSPEILTLKKMEGFAAGVSLSSWGRLSDKGADGSVAFVSSILVRNLSFYCLAIFFFF